MNKIINIRGTSGSGKSYLARQVMAAYYQKNAIHKEGRKQPLYYEMTNKGDGPPLFVIGHYECACGGTDTISTGTEGIFNLVRDLSQKGNVFFEGLLIGVEVTRTAKLVECGEVHVIALDTPLQTCLDGINERRRARGKMEPVPPANTTSKHSQVVRTMERLRKEAPGVITHSLSRDAALAKVKELLGL